MDKNAAEPYRDIDFTNAERGPVAPLDPGKTTISIRLDNRVLAHFRGVVDRSGGGNFQTLINDALLEYITERSGSKATRKAVRKETPKILERTLADSSADGR